jgi:phosphate starvation-inducible protein PhoH
MSNLKPKQTKQKKGNGQEMCDMELVQNINTANFRSENQKKLHSSIMQNNITFACGPAGTGKTFCAL